HDAALGAFGEYVDTFDAELVFAQAGSRDSLRSDLQSAAFGERKRPDFLVEIFDGPGAGGLAFGRSEVGEIERAILREIGIEQEIVQALGGDCFYGWHASKGRGDESGLRMDDAHRSGVFGNQNVAAGEKCHRPCAGESSGERLEVQGWRWLG